MYVLIDYRPISISTNRRNGLRIEFQRHSGLESGRFKSEIQPTGPSE